MRFVKMHGLGNDFVVLDGLTQDFDISPAQVIAMCHRRTGIGADGTITVRRCSEADFWMDYRNSDGTVAEMCGNGLRCLAKFVTDRGVAPGAELTVKTGAGVKRVRVDQAGGEQRITVNMGAPVLARAEIPMLGDPAPQVVDEALQVNGREVRITAVQVGNPHAVEFVDDVTHIPLEQWGPAMEGHTAFPQKVNAEFVQVLDPRTVRMRVWERGCGETLACGSGAVATAVAGALTGRTGRSVDVHLTLGPLHIEWDAAGDVYMTGPAAEVFRGEWPD